MEAIHKPKESKEVDVYNLLTNWGLVPKKKPAKISQKDVLLQQLKSLTTSHTMSGLQKQNIDELLKLEKELSTVTQEKQSIEQNVVQDTIHDTVQDVVQNKDNITWEETIRNSLLARFSRKDLETAIHRLGMTGASGMSIPGAVDKLLNLPNSAVPRPVNLDKDQEQAITSSQMYEKNIIYGPPGAGKTLVLSSIGQRESSKNPDARILYLAFNVNAEKTISKRLKFLGCDKKALPNRKQARHNDNGQMKGGCYVMTFDKYLALRTFDDESSCEKNLDFANHSELYYTGLKISPRKWEHWDIMVVDEMQDVSSKHMELIKQLEPRSDKIIYAGDPRQELYENTGYMSEYWLRADELGYHKSILSYNHRSRPEIVRLLNAFSAEHFGDLHVEQVPVRKESEEQNAVHETSVQENSVDKVVEVAINTCVHAQASLIAKRVVDDPNNLTANFVISPVTVQKYKGTAELVASIRQRVMNESQSMTYAKVLCELASIGEDPRSIVYIGNSYSLKGTEADSVAIVQGDVPYEEINISKYRIIRLLFVALSRARNTILISLNAPLRESGLLGFLKNFIKTPIKTSNRQISKLDVPKILRVRDDIADRGLFNVKMEELDESFIPITEQSEFASDYLGIVVEELCANAMGTTTPEQVKLHIVPSEQPQDIYCTKDAIVVNCHKQTETILKNVIKTFEEGNETDSIFAKLKWTLAAGSEWKLGNDFKIEQIKQGVADFANKMPSATIQSGRICKPIMAQRSTLEVGQIVGVTDIETEKNIIEVKHSASSASRMIGARQLVAYTAFGSKYIESKCTESKDIESKYIESKDTENKDNETMKGGIVYEAMKGCAWRVQLPPLKWTQLMARAILGSRQATFQKIRVKDRRRLFGWANLAVFVDIETWVEPYNDSFQISFGDDSKVDGAKPSIITEIGAVAVSLETDTVVDIFHAIPDGMSTAKQHDMSNATDPLNLTYYGFCPKKSHYNKTKNSQPKLKKEFNDWLKQVKANYGYDGEIDLVQWSGDDANSLEIEPNILTNQRDAHTLFRVWLDGQGVVRTGDTKLQNAMEQLSGSQDLFHPHRAFEDAVATMMVTLLLKN